MLAKQKYIQQLLPENKTKNMLVVYDRLKPENNKNGCKI